MKDKKRKLFGLEKVLEYKRPDDKPNGKLSFTERNKLFAQYKNSEKFRKVFGLDKKDVFVVPIRTKGVTGSGQLSYCHENVRSLVLRFGGKQVVGYLMEKEFTTNPKGEMESIENYVGHSVWETPEGNLVDVTLSEYANKKGEKKFYFIPLHKSTPLDKQKFANWADFMIPENRKVYDSSQGEFHRLKKYNFIKLVVQDSPKLETYSYRLLKALRKEIFHILEPINGDEWKDYSNFSQSSVSTGKNLTEILPKDEYKEVYARALQINPNGNAPIGFTNYNLV